MYYYTYRITNQVLSKHYYGSRKCEIEPHKDLGIAYFSSSSDHDFINDQIQNPHNYRYKVVGIYQSREAAYDAEIRLHARHDVKNNPSFYNKANQTSSGFTCNKEVGKKISAALVGKPSPHKGKTLAEICGDDKANELLANMRSRTVTLETRDKLSIARTGQKVSPLHIHKWKRPVSSDTKLKISKAVSVAKTQQHPLRGNTWDAFYGREKSAMLKQKYSESRIGKKKPLTDDGKKSVASSNSMHKTKVYRCTRSDGTFILISKRKFVEQISPFFDRLLVNEVPKNKSKYKNEYARVFSEFISIEYAGLLSEFKECHPPVVA